MTLVTCHKCEYTYSDAALPCPRCGAMYHAMQDAGQAYAGCAVPAKKPEPALATDSKSESESQSAHSQIPETENTASATPSHACSFSYGNEAVSVKNEKLEDLNSIGLKEAKTPNYKRIRIVMIIAAILISSLIGSPQLLKFLAGSNDDTAVLNVEDADQYLAEINRQLERIRGLATTDALSDAGQMLDIITAFSAFAQQMEPGLRDYPFSDDQFNTFYNQQIQLEDLQRSAFPHMRQTAVEYIMTLPIMEKWRDMGMVMQCTGENMQLLRMTGINMENELELAEYAEQTLSATMDILRFQALETSAGMAVFKTEPVISFDDADFVVFDAQANTLKSVKTGNMIKLAGKWLIN